MSVSDVHDEETNSISQSSEIDELENGYGSNDTDSLNLDDEEEEDDGNSFPITCLSDRLVGGSLVLHIDQTGPPVSAPACIGRGANQSTSTTTSLSDTASDNASTRAVMGDTPSMIEANAFPPGDEDIPDNSSQASMADSEADRVRRIHNSIFSSLENDLAELVRIREETIQFLETGVHIRPENAAGENVPGSPISESGNRNSVGGGGMEETQRFDLRDGLTYYTRPIRSEDMAQGNLYTDAEMTTTDVSAPPNIAMLQARTYTPVAKFDNTPPAKPAKPYLETGLASCDEKAVAARKILDKLQYGDPEDEGACFVRRFWRETSTVVDNSPTAPLSLDVAAIAQRTASLQASLEEAFDGLRLRLQQVQTEATTPRQEGQENNREDNGERTGRGGGESENINSRNMGDSNNFTDNDYYQNWDQETSIMNNPLNYDIFDELEEGNEAGPSITARINMAERRALATCRNRQLGQRQLPASTISSSERQTRTSTVGVGTDNGSRIEGAELDDDSTDDEEMMSYFRGRCNEISNNSSSSIDNRPSPIELPRTFSQESRAFFQEIGISEEMGQDLFNMFRLSEENVQLPSNLELEYDNVGVSSSEIPVPLFPRNTNFPGPNLDVNGENSAPLNSEATGARNEPEENEREDEGESSNSPPQIPLFDTRACIHIAPNREDECSTRVYLDENYLNFPIAYNNNNNHHQDQENQEQHDEE